MTVGLIYTHDIQRYVGRLALFALISQPFYALNADSSAFWDNLTNRNIFFTLVLSLLFMWGIPHRQMVLEGICPRIFEKATGITCF